MYSIRIRIARLDAEAALSVKRDDDENCPKIERILLFFSLQMKALFKSEGIYPGYNMHQCRFNIKINPEFCQQKLHYLSL